MNTPSQLPPYVKEADANFISVKTDNTPEVAAFLGGAGFERRPDRDGLFIKYVPDDDAKVQLFKELREYGICFSVGREWSPAEMFEWLRDQGRLSGKFKAIAWKGPDNWFIREQ